VANQLFPHLPPISKLFSYGEILPNEWYDERKKKYYELHERIEFMEKYEFIIACLIKSISFIEIDNKLLEKVDAISLVSKIKHPLPYKLQITRY
jgi:hypothetical protein